MEWSRANEGVGILTNEEIETKVTDWEAINSRIITINLELEEKIGIIQIYAPTEDSDMRDKDSFYEELQRTIDKVQARNRHVMIIGDWNARTGNNKQQGYGTMGDHGGEETLNNNGQRMIDFCINNQVLIGNSWFKHKTIHKITYEAEQRGQKSIIDYITYTRSMRYAVEDVKVIRGAELHTDHRLVVTDMKIKPPPKEKSRTYEKIKLEALENLEKREEYERLLTTKLNSLEEREPDDNQRDINERWKKFKEAIFQTAEKVCGYKRYKIGHLQKRTKWWNDQVKEKIKRKKEAWYSFKRTNTEEDKQLYIQKRNEAKEAVKQAKRDSWEDFGNKLEESHSDNQKQFWNIVKKLKGHPSTQIRNIKNQNGKLQTESDSILKTWRDYFAAKFDNEEDEAQQPERPNNQENREGRAEHQISEEEIKNALRGTRNGKAPGEDGITPELIKYGGPITIKWLRKIFQQAWDSETIPQDWEKNIIIPIHKKGDSTNCDNYRAICLAQVTLKIYSKIVEKRLRTQIENKLEEEQAAFRPNRQTQDHIYSLRIMIEKAIERNKTLYLSFLDLRAAFDKVPRKHIWEALEGLQTDPKLQRVIKSIYHNVLGTVRVNGRTSGNFEIKNGVKQGDSLSPLLFITYMDQIIKTAKRRTRPTRLGYHNLNPVYTQGLVYADDIVLISGNINDLQRNLDIWNTCLREKGMEINIEKSKILQITKEGTGVNPNISVNGQQLEYVDKYEYLGTIISMNGKIEQEVRNRISKASRVYYQINNTLIGKKEISTKTKIHLYKTIYTPTLTYGAESWTMIDKHKSMVTAAEMKYLRKVQGKTRRDRVRNKSIRDELDLRPLVDEIEEKQLNWYGHLVRMRNERIPKKMLEMRPDGKRARGRPRIQWEENIRRMAETRGKTIAEARILARDRTNYKKWTKNPTP